MAQRPNSYGGWYLLIILLWVIYAALTLFAPLSPASKGYNISFIQLEAIRLTIIVPILITWLLAVYGAIRFKRYANSIRGSSDGSALHYIAIGLAWFVAYIVSLSLWGAVLPYLLHSPILYLLASARNITNMLLSFIAFAFVFRGSVHLSRLVKAPVVWTPRRIAFLLLPFCVFAAGFTHLFYLNPDLYQKTTDIIPSYALPPSALLVVIVIPYLTMWLVGMLAVLNLRRYATTVGGSLYRKALSNLLRGMIGVIGFTIVLQLLSVLSGTMRKWELSSVLILVYAIIIMIAVSYGYIASGAKRLAKIEDQS